MSTTAPLQPSQPPQVPAIQLTPEEAYRQKQYKAALHYTSLGSLILCPVLIALPPRTALRTSVLFGCASVGANYLAYEYSGASLWQRARYRFVTTVNGMADTNSLPTKAQGVQERIRQEKLAREKLVGKMGDTSIGVGAGVNAMPVAAAIDSMKEEKAEQKEAWKVERDEREKEALEDGRGYWGLITEQIWDVWSWGKKEVEDIKEMDEKVVAAKRDEKK